MRLGRIDGRVPAVVGAVIGIGFVGQRRPAMVTINDLKSAEREVAVREERKGFIIRATVCTVVMTGLIILNLVLLAQTDDSFL
jgi:hypothetical protein